MSKREQGRVVRGAAFVVLGIASMMTPVGCGNRQPERGPIEQAGHDVDQAADDVSDAVDEAGEEIDEHTKH